MEMNKMPMWLTAPVCLLLVDNLIYPYIALLWS